MGFRNGALFLGVDGSRVQVPNNRSQDGAEKQLPGPSWAGMGEGRERPHSTFMDTSPPDPGAAGQAGVGAVLIFVQEVTLPGRREVKPLSQGPRAGRRPGSRHSPPAPCWLRVGWGAPGSAQQRALSLSIWASDWVAHQHRACIPLSSVIGPVGPGAGPLPGGRLLPVSLGVGRGEGLYGAPTKALIPWVLHLDLSKPLSLCLPVSPSISICLSVPLPASHPSVSGHLFPPHTPAVTLRHLPPLLSLLCSWSLSLRQG